MAAKSFGSGMFKWFLSWSLTLKSYFLKLELTWLAL